jgi:signal transduction histidine kinase
MLPSEVITFIVISILIGAFIVVGIIMFLILFRKNQKINLVKKEKLEQQHQQQLLEAQLDMQTQTMQEIGREIHDNVGQKLTLASLYTQQLDYDNKYPDITERVTSISNIINESLNELRNLSKNLTNSYIAEKPLRDLIEEEIEKIKLANNYQLNIQMDNANGYAVLTKTIVVRIVQEFFQNTMKHANATTLTLDLQKNKEGLSLQLKDDGKGFVYNENEIHKGIGLQNMKKRIALVGGTITINSMLKQGTTLHLTIPHKNL